MNSLAHLLGDLLNNSWAALIGSVSIFLTARFALQQIAYQRRLDGKIVAYERLLKAAFLLAKQPVFNVTGGIHKKRLFARYLKYLEAHDRLYLFASHRSLQALHDIRLTTQKLFDSAFKWSTEDRSRHLRELDQHLTSLPSLIVVQARADIHGGEHSSRLRSTLWRRRDAQRFRKIIEGDFT